MTRIVSVIAAASLLFAPCSLDACNKTSSSQSTASAPAQQASSAQAQQAPTQAPAATPSTPTPDELYQLVAPIALFPDNLVAQVLAASTFPDQVTAAEAWIKQNASLKGDALNQAVDKQTWDNSVKGLTQFPDVLNQMATNLSWTSALGDAYFNFPKDVMNAVQVMRKRAYDAGNLKSGEQQNVSVQSGTPAPAVPAPTTVIVQQPPQTIVIQPSQPTVVYVPTYNPTVVYGAPVPVYPGYSTGDMVATGIISFGLGIAVGAIIANNNHCCGWGWNSWGCGWHSSTVIYNHNTYISNSNTFINRNNYYNRNVNVNNRTNINNNINRNANVNRNNNYRANNFDSNVRSSNFSTPNFGTQHNQSQFRNTNGSSLVNNRQGANAGQQSRRGVGQNESRQQNLQQQRQPQRGYGGNSRSNGEQNHAVAQQQNRGTKSGAFSNYSQGGNARTNSARGQHSFGGGGGRSFGGGRHR